MLRTLSSYGDAVITSVEPLLSGKIIEARENFHTDVIAGSCNCVSAGGSSWLLETDWNRRQDRNLCR